MNFAMISAVSGGLAALDRLDAITTNLANVSTAGFKGLLHTQVADHANEVQRTSSDVRTPINRSRMMGDFTQGPIDKTGNPLHVALDGEGFFVVDTPQGERLTRRGSFGLDEEGYLVSSDRHRVQGEGGDLELGAAAQRGEAIQIGHDGSIQIGQTQVGKLRIVDGGDPSSMDREAGGLYRASADELLPAEEQSFTVHQGATEGSNVSAVEELVAMIEAMRGFEAYMNAMDRIDTINERSIRDVGRI